MSYEDYFAALTAYARPHSWQRDLASAEFCSDRLIRIPTGFGKTLGVLSAWMYHRVHRGDDRWPRRVVWCLPMRVLVEQTMAEVTSALDRVDALWDGKSNHERRVGAHLLMGGADSGEWHLHPEHCAVLIGTQDMLLSRALNRGYAAPRARWPMEFGLLNQDVLWVMDEVQLMDVGLATSAQLQAFRRDDAADKRKNLRPCCTWWMSATLQAAWLEKSPDTNRMMAVLPPPTVVPNTERTGHLWADVRKPCRRIDVKNDKDLARKVAENHIDRGRGTDGPTLVVVNKVDRAVSVYNSLVNERSLAGTDVRLVHSRFRGAERVFWRERFLNRSASTPGTDRIIVATQVIEAGVDISAGVLVTELAPWASLVQRFGRCARWGGEATVVVADFSPKDDVAAAPYAKDELDAAREALNSLHDVAPLHLEIFEEEHANLLPRLYPHEPQHLLLRHELDELFDTTPDLSGADIDISRFIRSGDERDLLVFWANLEDKSAPGSGLRPSRDSLCAVPFLKVRVWLCGDDKSRQLKKGMRAWAWDWQDGAWRTAEPKDLYPGQTVLVDATCGGYDYDVATGRGTGWDPTYRGEVFEVVATAERMRNKQCWRFDSHGAPVVSEKEVRAWTADEFADAGQDNEELSVADRWQTIATHGRQTGHEANGIARAIVPQLAQLFDLAGRWHDVGKAHPAFQASIRHAPERPDRQDIAKAPDAAWPCSSSRLYAISSADRRPGFRHEIVSVLALFGVLQRHIPDHSALLGPWRELLDKSGRRSATTQAETATAEPTSLEREVIALDADQFNLLAYLICAHHGKVRLAWHAGKGDQAANDGILRIKGVRDGDILPPVTLISEDGNSCQLPATRLDLTPAAAGLSARTGPSWTERVLELLGKYGPFALAWLEALLRAADQRASRKAVADLLLKADNSAHELAGNDSALAGTVGGGAQATSPAGDSPPRGPVHGDGGRAGGRELHTGTTRPPHSATRYVETHLGILSYQQLAPHLAERVALVEVAIGERQFASSPLDEFLILDLHRRVCADLLPDIAGRWRQREVQVGNHVAPAAWRVPMLMRDYAANLAARMAHAGDSEDLTIETLAFAEGELLHIHPFEDFNGRVTRLFIFELLYRFDLPIIDPASDEGEETQRYFAALRDYDKRDDRPLIAIWRERFDREARQ